MPCAPARRIFEPRFPAAFVFTEAGADGGLDLGLCSLASAAARNPRFAVGVAGIARGLLRGRIDNHLLDQRALGRFAGGFFIGDCLLGGETLGFDGGLCCETLGLFLRTLSGALVFFGFLQGLFLGEAGGAGFRNAGALGAARDLGRIVFCGTVLEFFEQRLLGGSGGGEAVGKSRVPGS